MEIVIVADRAALAETASSIIAEQVRRKPASVLGLATGSTPEETYARLAQQHRERGLSFAQVTTFNLDEYLGLPPEHNQSYRYFMNDRLFRHIDVRPEATHVPNGMAADPVAECTRYEAAIVGAGGIDLQLLGIGSDGHIAFNEPGSSMQSRTRVKTLTEQTIRDNAALFFGAGQEYLVPRFALTMGVGTILEARHLLLIAHGERKAAIVRAFIEGPITSMVTASALQLHPKVTVVLDEAAASELHHAEYYKWVNEQRGAYEAAVARLQA